MAKSNQPARYMGMVAVALMACGPTSAPPPERAPAPAPSADSNPVEAAGTGASDAGASDAGAEFDTASCDETHVLRRDDLNELLVDGVLSGLARFTPIKRDGNAAKVKVAGIRSGSALARHWIRNNDVIVTVNDAAVFPLEALLELRRSLRGVPHVRIVLEREDVPRTLCYWVQD